MNDRQKKETSNRFTELDAFRGLAVMLVVTFHYFTRFDQLYSHGGMPTQWAVFGEFGVHLFFMVSGFVILWSLERSRSPSQFVSNRFFRLYPTYWAGLIATFVVVSIMGLPGREADVVTFILNFSMLQGFVDSVSAVDGVYWSLKVELMFYFWMVVLSVLGGLRFLSVICLLMLCTNFMILGFGEAVSSLLPVKVFKVFFFYQYVHLFVAGMAMYQIWKGSDSKLCYINIVLSMLLNFFLIEWFEAIFVCLTYGLFFAAIKNRLRWICVKPLLFMGAISYPFYLVHQNIGYVVIRTVKELVHSSLLGILVAFLISTLLAWVIHLLVEKHLTRSLKNRASTLISDEFKRNATGHMCAVPGGTLFGRAFFGFDQTGNSERKDSVANS